MKTYSYLIDGEITVEKINKINENIEQSKPQGVSFSFEEDPLCLNVVVDSKVNDIKKNEIEEILIPIFEDVGLTLIVPANTKHFSFIGEPKKQPKMHSTSTLVAAVVITLVISVLFTYIFASGIMKNPFIKNDPSSDAVDISDATDQLEILNKIFAQLQFDYGSLDTDVLTDYLLKSYIAASGDKYAVYYNAEEYAAWKESQTGNNVGVGVTVTKSQITVNSKTVTVAEIIYVNESSPAKLAGLEIGDCIYAVGSGDKFATLNDIGYNEALDRMLGKVGTTADFAIYRPDGNGGYINKSFSITRTTYESDTVLGSVCQTNSKVGIIKLLSFGVKTPKQFSQKVDELKAQGCEYFIFDLRSNPGGDLNSIRAILSYFLNQGDLIISIKYSGGTNKQYFAEPVLFDEDDIYYECSISASDIGKYKDLKFNILTDKNTASAAELFTATVRDYNLGKIIGESRTYGKGCMQNIIPLTAYGIEGGLRVTTSMYYSKSGTVYHDIGIIPDIIEPLSNEAKAYSPYKLPHEKDNQLQTAINELIK